MTENQIKKHSIKLPTQYRAAIQITRKVILEKQSLNTLLFNEKHAVSFMQHNYKKKMY